MIVIIAVIKHMAYIVRSQFVCVKAVIGSAHRSGYVRDDCEDKI